MKLTPFLLVLFTLIKFDVCSGQEVIWKNSKNWKLYNIINKAGFTYSLDTLVSFQSTDLSNQTMHTFTNDISEWPKEKYSLWMGLYIATCELEDGKPRKIIISNYGGFFYDQLTKRYYELPIELKDQWLEFLNDNMKKMSTINPSRKSN